MNPVDKPRRHVDPTWWTRAELRAALAERDVAAIYRFLHRRGFSQCRIAALTGQNQSEVSAILTHGRQVTAYDVLARIADGLTIPRGLMGLAFTALPGIHDPATEDSDMRRRDLMGIAAKLAVGAGLASADLALLASPAAAAPVPQRIGLTDIRQVQEMTRALDAQRSTFGGGSCREAAIGYLNWAVELRGSTMNDDVQRELNRALTDLESLIGHCSYDQLLYGAAQRFHVRSAHSATLADDPARVAHCLDRLGQVHWEAGQHADALRVYHLALPAAEDAGSPRLSAAIHQHQAMVHARRGDATRCQTALTRAADLQATAEPDPPAWILDTYPDSEELGTAALCHSDLAAHHLAHAVAALETVTKAIEREPASDNRNQRRALRLGVAALNAYRSADPDLGNRTTAALLPLLPSLNSTRVAARLRPLAIEAATHDSTAADLAQRLRGVLQPA